MTYHHGMSATDFIVGHMDSSALLAFVAFCSGFCFAFPFPRFLVIFLSTAFSISAGWQGGACLSFFSGGFPFRFIIRGIPSWLFWCFSFLSRVSREGGKKREEGRRATPLLHQIGTNGGLFALHQGGTAWGGVRAGGLRGDRFP